MRGILSGAILTFAVIGHSVAQIGPGWFRDQDTGCQIWDPRPGPNQSIRWIGACENGFASGAGILTFYQNGVFFADAVFSTANGRMFDRGRKIIDEKLLAAKAQFQITTCTKSMSHIDPGRRNESYRVIRGDVADEIELADHDIVLVYLSIAEKIVWRDCPSFIGTVMTPAEAHGKPYLANVNVSLHQAGKPIVHARSSDRRMDFSLGRIEDRHWSEYENTAYNRARGVWAERRAADERRIRQEHARRVEEARRAEERRQIEAREAEKARARALYEGFIKDHSVEEWPGMEQLQANPFVFRTKTVGLVTRFRTMIDPTKAIFAAGDLERHAIVVEGIPEGRFTTEANVLLAVKPLGKIDVKLPRVGEASVPRLSFVGVYFCKVAECRDALVWRE